MSETRTPISGVLEELEIKAGELSPDRFSDKTEQIKKEMQSKRVKTFIDAGCVIMDAYIQGWIDQDQKDEKDKKLVVLAGSRLESNEIRHLVEVYGLLDTSQKALSAFFPHNPDEKFSIYSEALKNNVILPKLGDFEKMSGEGYLKHIIIPGQIGLDELIANQRFFLLEVEELDADEERIRGERSSKFYTLSFKSVEKSTSALPNPKSRNEAIDGFIDHKRKLKEEKGLSLTGLTMAEYIWMQNYHFVSKAELGLAISDIKGLDTDCGTILLDESVRNKSTGRYDSTVAFWGEDNLGKITFCQISNGKKAIKNFMELAPRFAINFSEESNV